MAKPIKWFLDNLLGTPRESIGSRIAGGTMWFVANLFGTPYRPIFSNMVPLNQYQQEFRAHASGMGYTHMKNKPLFGGVVYASFARKG